MADTLDPVYALDDLREIDPGTRLRIKMVDHDLVREDFRGKTIDCEFRQLDLAPEWRTEATGEKFEDSRYWMIVADPSPGALQPFANDAVGGIPMTLVFGVHIWLIEDIQRV